MLVPLCETVPWLQQRRRHPGQKPATPIQGRTRHQGGPAQSWCHHCQSAPNWNPWSFPVTQEPFLITLNTTTHPHVFPWRPKCCRMPLSGSSVFIAALNKIDQLTINILNTNLKQFNQPVLWYIVFCPKCRVVEEFNLHLYPSLLGNIKWCYAVDEMRRKYTWDIAALGCREAGSWDGTITTNQ